MTEYLAKLNAVTTPPTDIDRKSARRPRLQRSEHRLLLAAGDVCSATTAVLVALWAWSLTTGFPFSRMFFVRWVEEGCVAALLWVILLSRSRKLSVALSLDSTLRVLLGVALVLLGGYALAYFYAAPGVLPRLPALYFLWEATLLTLGWRLAYLFVFTRASSRRLTLVVGAGAAGRRMAALLKDLARDTEAVAFLDDDDVPRQVSGLPVYPLRDLDSVVQQLNVTEVLLAKTEVPENLLKALVGCQERGVPVVPMAVEYEHLLQRVPVEHLEDRWMFTSLSEWMRARDASTMVKRAVDMIGGFVGLIALGLVTPLVGTLLLLESGRPVFYRQLRLGAGGKPFWLLKFRTMVRDAEDEGPRWAAAADPRITRVGRWLRRSRLDELPQVINILEGSMSLVGPRPERPEFVDPLERAIPFYRIRLMVTPGLTGWAQVKAAYSSTIADALLKLEYDLYYIKHRSFLFDLRIIMSTVATILGLRGR